MHIDIASVRIDRRELEEDLQSGEIDVAWTWRCPYPATCAASASGPSALVVLARVDHPVVDEDPASQWFRTPLLASLAEVAASR